MRRFSVQKLLKASKGISAGETHRYLRASPEDFEEGLQESGQRIAAPTAAVCVEQLHEFEDGLLLRETALDAVHVFLQPGCQRFQGRTLPVLTQSKVVRLGFPGSLCGGCDRSRY